MSDDMIDSAAEVIQRAIDKEPHERRLYPDLYAEQVARALADEGRLATPEHDRAVAAETLRDAADALEMKLGVEGAPRDLWEFRQWMRVRSDAIEAGEHEHPPCRLCGEPGGDCAYLCC